MASAERSHGDDGTQLDLRLLSKSQYATLKAGLLVEMKPLFDSMAASVDTLTRQVEALTEELRTARRAGDAALPGGGE